MLEINLLPNKSRLQLKQIQTIKQANKIATLLLAVFTVASLIAIGAGLYMSSQIRKNQQKLEAAKSDFFQYLDKIDEMQNLRFRTKLVAQTLDTRPSFSFQEKKLREILGEKASFKKILITAEDGVKMEGFVPSLADFSAIESRLSSIELSEKKLSKLGVDENGQVSFALQLKVETK